MTTSPRTSARTPPPGGRLAYEDAASAAEMRRDGRAAERRLGVGRLERLDRAIAAALASGVPSLHADEQPRERTKPALDTYAAAARVAAALHLHVD